MAELEEESRHSGPELLLPGLLYPDVPHHQGVPPAIRHSLCHEEDATEGLGLPSSFQDLRPTMLQHERPAGGGILGPGGVLQGPEQVP